ncbi:MAG: hypothetical protein PHR61_00845 [Candidatus Absconditabacteria bacterium]|nr:hypothetical protein [Candidatus Absconditabacteria bacterium]
MPFGIHPEERNEFKSPFSFPIDNDDFEAKRSFLESVEDNDKENRKKEKLKTKEELLKLLKSKNLDKNKRERIKRLIKDL